jgi:pimeloyl-ACP methyl ester carboxylesterase
MSDLISPESAQAFLQMVPHAQYADIKDAGHMVAGDQNDVFSAAVLDFLRQLR